MVMFVRATTTGTVSVPPEASVMTIAAFPPQAVAVTMKVTVAPGDPAVSEDGASGETVATAVSVEIAEKGPVEPE
jgi:hypothetical protein